MDDRLRVVEVEWIDADHGNSWELDSDVTVKKTPKSVFSVGYLLESNEQGVSMAATRDMATKNVNGAGFIPRGCIVNEWIYEVG